MGGKGHGLEEGGENPGEVAEQAPALLDAGSDDMAGEGDSPAEPERPSRD